MQINQEVLLAAVRKAVELHARYENLKAEADRLMKKAKENLMHQDDTTEHMIYTLALARELKRIEGEMTECMTEMENLKNNMMVMLYINMIGEEE